MVQGPCSISGYCCSIEKVFTPLIGHMKNICNICVEKSSFIHISCTDFVLYEFYVNQEASKVLQSCCPWWGGGGGLEAASAYVFWRKVEVFCAFILI
jgi:hypothetical protein